MKLPKVLSLPDSCATLAVAIALSVLTHTAMLLWHAPQARKLEGPPPPVGRMSVRVLSSIPAMLPVALPAIAPHAKPRAGSGPALPATPPDAPVERPTETRSSSAQDPGWGVTSFDPRAYLPPSAVDERAAPVSAESLELLQLTGHQPGLWVMRLFIAETGSVDEVEVVEARGADANTAELTALLRSVRFTPALSLGSPVKSQKLLEFSFEPGPEPLLPVPVPGPSATGK